MNSNTIEGWERQRFEHKQKDSINVQLLGDVDSYMNFMKDICYNKTRFVKSTMFLFRMDLCTSEGHNEDDE